jgi:hypothetical protein
MTRSSVGYFEVTTRQRLQQSLRGPLGTDYFEFGSTTTETSLIYGDLRRLLTPARGRVFDL